MPRRDGKYFLGWKQFTKERREDTFFSMMNENNASKEKIKKIKEKVDKESATILDEKDTAVRNRLCKLLSEVRDILDEE